MSQEHTSPPGISWNEVETIEYKVCMAMAVGRASSTSSDVVLCLWWISKQKCFQHRCNSLMYPFADGIGLRVFCSLNRLYVQHHNSYWKTKPVNSPSSSWMTCIGLVSWGVVGNDKIIFSICEEGFDEVLVNFHGYTVFDWIFCRIR